MSPFHFGRTVALPLAVLLALGGCVAVPVAQLAAQAMSGPAASSDVASAQVARQPDTAGLSQAASALLRHMGGGVASH